MPIALAYLPRSTRISRTTIRFNVNNMAEKELCKTQQKPKKRVKYEQKFKIEYRDKFKCVSKSALATHCIL